MNDHVAATLDGAVPALGGAMRWQPPGAAWAALRRACDQVVEVLRDFAAAVKTLLETILTVLRPVLAVVGYWDRRRRDRLSAMRAAYHRRRRR